MSKQGKTEITRDNIPLPIQREVRQRCGFGCVICGMPLYEYEHMEGWANVKRHVAEEITLLCDQHHREKTGRLLPIEVVRDANTNPFNLRKGVSKPYNLHFSGKKVTVEIGTNTFDCEYKGSDTFMMPLFVDNIPLIGIIISDEHLLLNVAVFDEYNSLILQIKNNQLLYNTEPWDIQLVGTKLTIRQAHRKILVEFDFQPPDKIVVTRGKFLCNGVEILIRPTNILITNNSSVIMGNSTSNVQGGLIIGKMNKPMSGFTHIEKLNRYLGDNKAAIKREKEVLKMYK